MKAHIERIIHYAVLTIVTLVAIVVMWMLSAKGQLEQNRNAMHVRKLSRVAAPKALVSMEPLTVEIREITSNYAGKIQPWEMYQVGFEVGGRVASLGENRHGQPLDEGDRVDEGQVLALLDDRVFRAQKSEAAARVEQAASDLQRAQRVRQANPAAMSESELQSLVTELALARAQHEVAIKNLEDATLKAPVNAVISQRLIKSGESVSPHQLVFELVQNEDVLLVVDVPESHIRELELRKRIVEENQASSNPSIDPEDRVFRAHVNLEGTDRFGNPWPPLDGEVYRIAETADSRTGLFPVEIRLSNEQQMLRPGMVATADIVIKRIPGYQIPESSVIFRQRRAHLFSIDHETVPMELLYWEVGPTELHRARRVDLSEWVDQGPNIVVPADTVDLENVVTRGHLRLADSQLVRVVDLAPAVEETGPELERDVRPSDIAAKQNQR